MHFSGIVRLVRVLKRTGGRMGRQTDIAQLSYNFALIRCFKGPTAQDQQFYLLQHIDKTFIPSMRRLLTLEHIGCDDINPSILSGL